jgi:hypothetical protein
VSRRASLQPQFFQIHSSAYSKRRRRKKEKKKKTFWASQPLKNEIKTSCKIQKTSLDYHHALHAKEAYGLTSKAIFTPI